MRYREYSKSESDEWGDEWELIEDEMRTDYEPEQPGFDWEEAAGEYRHGWSSRRRYAGKEWAEVEPYIRREWEENQAETGRSWEAARQNIRRGWEKGKK